MKEAFISIYNLNGQNLLNIKTKADSMELGNLIQRQGIYVIRVVIENKMGDVKYFKY